jgi:hypothetical protein
MRPCVLANVALAQRRLKTPAVKYDSEYQSEYSLVID